MKSAKKLNGLLVVVLVLIANFNLNAATYTTRANGNWNDMATVWSLDGGATPCGCTPGALSSGNDIVINHNITTDYNIVLNAGTTMTINVGASLVGGHRINMFNSDLNVYGQTNIQRVIIGVNANIYVGPGAIMSMSNQFNIEGGGTVTIDGGQITSGGLRISNGGSLIIMNSAKMQVVSGNIQNYGIINVDASSCISSNGNWSNNMTGQVLGTGSAISGGNISNAGIWDPAIVWCSTGGDLGMTSPENCGAANGICFAIILPIELVDFTAELIDKEYVQLYWATASELNNDYFMVMRSTDGVDWTEIDRVDGAGTTVELTEYYTEDYDVIPGVAYYKLIQVDIDSRESESDVVAVEFKLASEELTIYPNPARGATDITLANLDEGNATISIYNTSGVLMKQIDKNDFSDFVRFNSSELDNGLYIINVEQDGNLRQTKLMVSK